MMSKSLKLIILLGMVVGAHAGQKVERVHKDDFKVLCGVMSAATGLWYTYAELEYEDEKNITKLGKIIEKVLFGSNWDGYRGGSWILTPEFTKKTPERSAVCGLNGRTKEMPLASDSLASSIFCLCTPTKDDKKVLCALDVVVEGTWPEENKIHNVQNVFEEVWDGTGVSAQCVGHESDDLEKEKQNFAVKLTELKNILNRENGILGKNGDNCDKSNGCANVTKKPAWLEKLEEIESLNLTRSPTASEIHEPRIVIETPPAPPPESMYVPTETPKHTPVKSTVSEEHHKPETRKVPLQQELEEKPKEIPQKAVEDPLTVPEDNETNGFITTIR